MSIPPSRKNPIMHSLWLRVTRPVEVEVRRRANYYKTSVSEYLRRIVIAHLESGGGMPRERTVTITDTKVLLPSPRKLTVLDYNTTTLCLLEGREMTLGEAARTLGISFMLLRKRLRMGHTLEKIANDCWEGNL